MRDWEKERGVAGGQEMRNVPRQGKRRNLLRCRHQVQRRRRLRQRHQLLRLQRRQPPPPRPPAHRHVFAKLTAASAAPRGCVSRCCSPHPRWRTPLWAEEVYAGCACQHSTAWIFVCVCCGPM
ncbi:mucin TcMUCII [Trypanosoma cruzi Dm28c]|uniref:Mucin TcMUCII n=1 Tax=Trypanosoma cruzi Dm28c TaxID=1416333 RepID=V5A2P7_TRYCR|nr:mucin TcMUCII [Trypanosoma cruzi Dm28c]